MTTCESNQAWEFLAGQLSVAEETEFVQHLNECFRCRQSLEHAAGDEAQWQFVSEVLRCSRELPGPGAAGSAAQSSSGFDVWQRPGRFDEDAITNEEAGRIDLSFLAPTDDPVMLGRVGAFEISGVIGCGAMGIVLKGFDRSLNRTVAVKVLHPVLAQQGAARQRFARETRAMAAVSHEQVVAVYAVDEHANLPYFVMEYAPGGTLEKRLAMEGPLGTVEVLRVGLQVARGLAAAHRQGLVHRDIKPSNILLHRGIERVRVADFGLARVQHESGYTRTGLLVGTPQYMSPEQIRGEPCDARSDLFSLGSVLYALCTGHPPFRAESIYAVLQRIAHDEARSIREQNPEVPVWLEAIILRLLAKEKSLRFQTAEEVAEAFEQELAHVQNPVGARAPLRAWWLRGDRIDPVDGPAKSVSMRTPDQVDCDQGVLKFRLTSRRRILAMTMLSMLGIGLLSFALISPDGVQRTAVDSQGMQVSGVVKAVNFADSTVTVADKAGRKTFVVTKDAYIVIAGKQEDLVRLTPGTVVTLTLLADQMTARSIEAEPPQVSGIVKIVDVDKNTVTLADDMAEKTFTVTKDALVEIDGKRGTLAEVPTGSHVSLSRVDVKTVDRIRAVGLGFQGLVKAVDAEKNTLTVAHRYLPSEPEKTLVVAKDAPIEIDGQRGKLAGLPTGAIVNVGLSADQKTARSIQAAGPGWRHVVVRAVDAGKATITFDDQASPPGTFTNNGPPPVELAGKAFAVVDNASITIDGRPGKLSGLPPGALVTLSLSADQTAVRSIEAYGPGWGRVLVKGVDAKQSTITFDDDMPTELAGKTLPVASDASIRIDDKPGTLAAVPSGVRIDVGLSADRKTVCSFQTIGLGWARVVVKAIDAETGTMTFDDNNAPAELAGKTLPVTGDASIRIDDKPGKLSELPRGASIDVGLSADGKMVRSLQANGPGWGGVFVKAIDSEKNTITFDDDKAPAELAGKTLSMATDADIMIDGRPGKLSGLPPGVSVALGLGADQKTVRRLQANGPGWGDVFVKGIDAKKNTIAFDDDKAPAELAGKTLSVAKDASIQIDGQSGNLAGLPSGASINVGLSVDQKTVRSVQAKGPAWMRVGVKVIDAEKNTITFDDDNAPAELAGKTLSVARDADIRVNGQPARLAAVPPEASINVGLSVDQKTVRSIAVGP